MFKSLPLLYKACWEKWNFASWSSAFWGSQYVFCCFLSEWVRPFVCPVLFIPALSPFRLRTSVILACFILQDGTIGLNCVGGTWWLSVLLLVTASEPINIPPKCLTFFWYYWFELRASHLLGRCSITGASPTDPKMSNLIKKIMIASTII
jgi:hypothetical protein